MNTNPLVPAFYYYKFAQAISGPYTSLDAFQAGTIDASGNILKPESSIDPFEYFVIKLKKIFEQLPPGMTKASLSSYIPALQMFSEELEQYGVDYHEMELFLEGYIASHTDGQLSYIELCEDMASANLGGPAASTNTGGISGYDPPMQSGVLKRKSVLGFEDSCDMFDVCPDDYKMFVGAKKWRHVPEGESKRYIYRRLGRTGKKVAIRNSETGEIHFPMFEEHKPIDEYFASKLLDSLKSKSLKKENLQETSSNLLKKSGGEVENYTDEYDDKEYNVATKRNSEERSIGVSPRELGDTAEIIRSKYEEQREKERISAKKTEATTQARKMWKKGISGPGYAKEIPEEDIALGMGGAEKYALGTEFESSVGAIPRIIKKLGPRGEELAAQWHGAMRKFAERDISSHAPVDYVGLPSVEELQNTDSPWQDLLRKYDAKSIKATSPRRLNPESFAEVEYNGQKGFPKINGVYAYQAQAKAKEDKDEKEVERIQKEILDPFFQNKQVQEIMSSEYRESIAKKMKDAGSQMVLATRPGQRLIPIGDPELQKVFVKGFRPRLVHGGTQPVSKSVLNFQPASNLGISGVGSKREQTSLPEQDPAVAHMVGSDVARVLGNWLRPQK